MNHQITAVALGVKLKRLRLQRGYTIEELSSLAKVGKATLSTLEAGGGNPRLETLNSLAAALRLPLGDLISPGEPDKILIKGTPDPSTFSQEIISRLPAGLASEVWRLRMRPGQKIQSPAHSKGTFEHIFIFSGHLRLTSTGFDHILRAGDFLKFSADLDHSYETNTESVDGAVIMSYVAQF